MEPPNTIPQPHKCPHCQTLVMDMGRIKDNIQVSEELKGLTPKSGLQFPFDLTRDELFDGAEQGCLLMKWIMGQRQFRRHSGFSTYLHSPSYLRVRNPVFQMQTWGEDLDIKGVFRFEIEYGGTEGLMKMAQTTDECLWLYADPGKNF